jgi:hypothetical protein
MVEEESPAVRRLAVSGLVLARLDLRTPTLSWPDFSCGERRWQLVEEVCPVQLLLCAAQCQHHEE